MRDRLIYVMSGPAHLPYLVVSLDTLRRYYSGEVVIYVWPESAEFVHRIADDRRLFVDSVDHEPLQRGRNAQFLDKIRVARSLGKDVDRLIYLDADTTIHGSLQLLFDVLDGPMFAATQFCDWTTTGGIVSRRLAKLREIPEVNGRAIDVLLDNPFPSVNGGVWSTRPDNEVLQLWEDYTAAAKEKAFIADEAVLHLMQVLFDPTAFMVLTDGGRWNCSPKYQNPFLSDEQVVIRHYHGDSNTRPDKSKKGYEEWWLQWQKALATNLGGCSEWWPVVQSDRRTYNKWMQKLEEMEAER